RALARESAPEPDRGPPSPWFLGAVLGLLVLLGVLENRDWIGKATAFVLGTAWLGSWLVLRRSPPAPAATWTRIGAAGGLIAFLVHLFVDFQLYEAGVAVALVAALALIALLRGGTVEVRLPRAVCLAATAALLALTVPLLVWITPRVLAADNEMEEARAALYSVDAGWAANPAGAILDAARIAQSAQQHNPVDPEAYLLFARAKMREWSLLQATKARDPGAIEEAEGMVLQAMENAIRLRPLLSPTHEE